MGDWALRDIGRAKTKIYLGKTKYGDIEDKYTYQEFSLDSMKQDVGAQDLQLYPAERWSSHFKTYSPLWEVVQELGGYKLVVNQNPSAPQQTFIYGCLSSESSIPDYTTDYFPDNNLYIEADVSGPGTSVSSDISVEEQTFLPAIEESDEGIPAIQIAAGVIREEPFIPSSIDDLASDADIYRDIIKSVGIKTHNIWNMTKAYTENSNIRYIRSWGPSWTSSQYAGAIAEQSGSVGDMKIKVNANKGSLMLYRMAPMNCDIGLDSQYPWIFPYVDEGGKPKHGLFLSEQLGKEGGLFGNEYRTRGGAPKNLYNIGFKITVDVSAEAQRGAFAGSGGVAPTINVQWGWGSDPEKGFTPESIGSFASSFCINLSHNKVPILTYHDGERLVNISIEDTPSDFSSNSRLELTVEYLGTAMLVKVGQSGSRLISGKTGIDGSGLKGVWTKNPNISVFFAGCSAIFQFMPVYYNPWSPASDIRLNPDSVTVTDENHTPSQLGFDINHPKSGFAKMMAVSSFNTYASPADQESVFNDMYNSILEAFDAQTYSPLDLIQAASGYPYSKFKPEDGWPQCILDSRNIPLENGAASRVLQPIAQVFSFGQGIKTNFSQKENLPILAEKDPMSSMSIIWQVRTSCTTPIVYGFKTKDVNYIEFPKDREKDISEYVTSWNINWKSELDYKILRAEAEINLLNPPGYLIDVLSKNIMNIRISDSGYREYSNAVEENIKDFIYRDGNVFVGITTGTSLKTGPGGDVTFTVSCVDPIKLLEDYRLETNLRFDGVSYFTAFSMLMQASDYGDQLLIEDGINDKRIVGGWKQAWRGGFERTVFGTATRRPITWDCMNSAYLYGSMFFGYQPMIGKSFEVQPATLLMDELRNILDNMHNPSALPLFFYRPSDNVFVLQVRDGLTSAEESEGITSGKRRPKLKSEFESEEELKYWLPILCVGNSDAYEMKSDLSNICSHFTVLGIDRATGLSIKATAINPKWRILDNYSLDATGAIVEGDVSSDYKYDSSGNIAGMLEHTSSISGAYGHIGYKRRAFKPIGNFIADMPSAYGYAMSRMWWLMRPEITINGLTVYGLIDYLDEGLLNVNLSGLPYLKCLINNSSISYDANEGTIISKVGVYIFPPWSM